jgi:hemin uptake protein HemP
MPQPDDLLLGFGWRALQLFAAAGWLPTCSRREPPAHTVVILVTSQCGNRQSPQRALYIDCKLQALDCAPIELYKVSAEHNFGAQKTEMATTSGDNIGGPADSAPSAARSITMNGNRIESRELFAVEREIIIAHGEDFYRLRLTSQNKLILTK